ncbi:metallophosphoesterase family protein [Flindersiella endophytica]
MTVRVAQISDLHFGRHVPQVAEGLLADLKEEGPALVAVCGDLTQTAREWEFRAAREFLDQLPAPALVVPGNHDLPGWRFWSRFARPWRRWRRNISDDPNGPAIHRAAGIVAVGVNTARRWGFHPDWSRGRINSLQLAGILYALGQADPDDVRIVVAHHPFLLTHPGRNRGLVGRSELALEKLHQRADLLLGGHIHLAYSGVVDGMVVAQSGTAISNRLKGEPNSYNLIDVDGGGMTVETRHWTGDGFETARSSRYARDGHDWSPG